MDTSILVNIANAARELEPSCTPCAYPSAYPSAYPPWNPSSYPCAHPMVGCVNVVSTEPQENRSTLAADVATAAGVTAVGVAGVYAYVDYCKQASAENSLKALIDDHVCRFTEHAMTNGAASIWGAAHNRLVTAAATWYSRRQSRRVRIHSTCGLIGGLVTVVAYRVGWKIVAGVGFAVLLASGLDALLSRLLPNDYGVAEIASSADALVIEYNKW